jgi:RHS repeat-associated protein
MLLNNSSATDRIWYYVSLAKRSKLKRSHGAAGRMATMSINGVLQGSYKYDFAGRQAVRTLTSPTAVTLHSVFDSQGRRIAEYNEATGALIREYVWMGWEPIAVIEGSVVSFIRTDHIGRPVFATNTAGTKVWTASYTPFGGVRTTTGTPINARFPGQWFQSESGLHQNWMRDYDPTTGRYLQADPLGLVAGASVYGYANQSPMMSIDPRGLWTIQIGLSGSLTFFGVTVSLGIGLALDGHGNLGGYATVGGGPGYGSGGSFGVALGGSNGETICDLKGLFSNYGGNAGAGLNAGGEGYYGPGSQGQLVIGGGAVLGIGVGSGGYVGPTYTFVAPINTSENCGC